MIIRSSHLCLRFYAGDGWTPEILVPCLERGSIEVSFPDDPHHKYYRLAVGSRFIVSLLLTHVSGVETWKNKMLPAAEWSGYISRMNW